ncbi:MAG: AtpZ/AtpI family protein [Alphaproteobacteria bacterium]|nr:AtpZ/AtpI family protein [Alphaproteobacteria bacterium]
MAEDERKSPPSLDDLESRLRAARAREDDEKGAERAQGRANSAGMGLGFRVAIELVAGVMVGFGIGYGLDLLFGTLPLLMVVFLFLGAAAGVLNVYRTAKGMGEAVGLGEAQRRMQERTKDGSDQSRGDGRGEPG